MSRPQTAKPGQKVRGSAGKYSALYATQRWRHIRARHLEANPLCVFCLKQGRTTVAKICDHVEPHRGDMNRFWYGNLQGLCATCHNSTKQALEKSGRSMVRIGEDGWPIE